MAHNILLTKQLSENGKETASYRRRIAADAGGSAKAFQVGTIKTVYRSIIAIALATQGATALSYFTPFTFEAYAFGVVGLFPSIVFLLDAIAIENSYFGKIDLWYLIPLATGNGVILAMRLIGNTSMPIGYASLLGFSMIGLAMFAAIQIRQRRLPK
jgi:hypothetical protein